MEKIILDYPKKKLNWIPLTKIKNLNTERQNVLYRYNDNLYDNICFRNVFGQNILEGDILEICLNPKKNRYCTKYTNLKKYVKHLNKLYSGAKISIFYEESKIVPEHYGIWLRVSFSKNYPRVVLKDICTRIRFLHESPYQEIMDELLTKKGFKLRDIEEKVSTLESYAVNTGHYLFSSAKSIMKTYKNYEERVLNTVKIAEDEEEDYTSLHYVLNKIKNEEN